MNIRCRSIAWMVALAFAGVVADVGVAPSVQAQIKEGEFGLYQSSSLVGWAYASADRSKEYWAYIDGSYSFAEALHSTSTSRWHLDAQHIGSGSYPTFAAFKSAVLGRVETQGHVITFQNHSVSEEQVSN